MARRTRDQQFAALESEDVRKQIPKKILPLIEQLVMEQCSVVNAAASLRVKLLEIRVKELEKRLGIEEPQPYPDDPMDDWEIEIEDENDAAESAEDSAGCLGDEPDEDNDDEIPF